jgi:hypothetical protein
MKRILDALIQEDPGDLAWSAPPQRQLAYSLYKIVPLVLQVRGDSIKPEISVSATVTTLKRDTPQHAERVADRR